MSGGQEVEERTEGRLLKDDSSQHDGMPAEASTPPKSSTTPAHTLLSFCSLPLFFFLNSFSLFFLRPSTPRVWPSIRRTRLPSLLSFPLLPSLPRLSLRRADKKVPAPSRRRNHGNAPASHVLTSQRVKYNRLPRATKTSRRLFRRRLAAELPRVKKGKKEGPDTYIIRDYLSGHDRR